MDMAEKLKWLDEEYLGKYDRKEIDSEIQIQKKFKEPIEREIFYSVSESETLDHATYLSINTQAGNVPEGVRVVSMILSMCLDALPLGLRKRFWMPGSAMTSWAATSMGSYSRISP